jgi:hypothetical protein
MEPISLATVVVGSLTTLGTSLATGAAQRVLSGLDRVAQLVRDRLSGDAASLDLVEEVIAAPTESSQERLTLRLAQQFIQDPEFGEALEQALEEAGTGSTIQAQDAGVVAGGDVRMKGKYVAGRDLSIGRDDRS